VKPRSNLEGVDDPEESTANLEGLDDPEESLANLEGENSDQKSEIIAIKKELRQQKSKIQHLEKANKDMMKERTAVCGYQDFLSLSSDTTLTFERVYDEVNSGGKLEENGYFTAQVSGVYFVTLKASVELKQGESLRGDLKLSSGNYDNDGGFIWSSNDSGSGWNQATSSGYILDQASASRYVKMSAGETLHIELIPKYPYSECGGKIEVYYTTMCVSLYSASG